MKKTDIIKAVQDHIDQILKQIAAGQLVEVVLAGSDEEAQGNGWPSRAVMVIGLEQLKEALPDDMKDRLKVVSKAS